VCPADGGVDVLGLLRRNVEQVIESESHRAFGIGIGQCAGKSLDEKWERARFWPGVVGFPAGDLKAGQIARVGELLLGEPSPFAPSAEPRAVERKTKASSRQFLLQYVARSYSLRETVRRQRAGVTIAGPARQPSPAPSKPSAQPPHPFPGTAPAHPRTRPQADQPSPR
jgi:hypothetical protein